MARTAFTFAVALALALLCAVAPAFARVSADTAALQVALRANGLYGGTVDGIAGPGTRAAVRALQARRGLAVDGIAGPRTRRVLGRRGRPRLGSRALAAPARGWDVAALQFLLARHGFPSGPVDGGLGARTDAALRRFQAWAGLAADGVAGPATLAALRRGPPRSILRFRAPLAGAPGDRFGPRGAMFHTGQDYPAPRGTPVGAAGYGCVEFAGFNDGYGRLVVIRHRLGMTSWYAHLSRITVPRGRCVVAGDLIGRVGSSGRSTGPHLHFELRLRGAAVDPRSGL
jgi:murein DD-endopeptidase MepM/ murein hydrolase activator NlpD